MTAAAGSVVGDPHFTTFAGQHFNFQGAGEYTLAQSNAVGDSFDVQIHTAKLEVGSAVTFVTANSARVGNVIVTFDIDRAHAGNGLVWIDGHSAPRATDGAVLMLADGHVVRISADRFQVVRDTGEIVDAVVHDAYLDVTASLAPNEDAATVAGLLAANAAPLDQPD